MRTKFPDPNGYVHWGKQTTPRAGRTGTILKRVRERANKKGLPFNLTKEDIIIPSHCPIFGIPLIFSKGNASDCSPSVDRIDNTKGYTKDNIVIISWLANRIKSNHSVEQLEKIVKFYRQKEKAQ